MKPNKKLIAAVLGNRVGSDGNIQISDTIIHYSNITHMSSMSIYEFMFLCKVLAEEEGIIIWSSPSFIQLEDQKDMIKILSINGEFSEPEAVIDKCNQLIENNWDVI